MLHNLSSQDYYLSIQSHVNLGLYYLNAQDRNRVIYHMLKATYLMLVAFGETAPDLLVSLANLARGYQLGKEYSQAIKCYEMAM